MKQTIKYKKHAKKIEVKFKFVFNKIKIKDCQLQSYIRLKIKVQELKKGKRHRFFKT